MDKWSFFFDKDNIVSMVKDETENKKIRDMILEGDGILEIPGDKHLFINMAAVKCTVREIVDETIVPDAT